MERLLKPPADERRPGRPLCLFLRLISAAFAAGEGSRDLDVELWTAFVSPFRVPLYRQVGVWHDCKVMRPTNVGKPV